MNDIMTRGGFPLMAKTRRVGNRLRVYENLMPYANNFRKTAFLKKKKKKKKKKERRKELETKANTAKDSTNKFWGP